MPRSCCGWHRVLTRLEGMREPRLGAMEGQIHLDAGSALLLGCLLQHSAGRVSIRFEARAPKREVEGGQVELGEKYPLPGLPGSLPTAQGSR